MEERVKSELREVLADWQAGRPVRVIVLGHPVRVIPGKKNEPATLDRHVFRQSQVYDYVFVLLGLTLTYLGSEPLPAPMTHDDFKMFCHPKGLSVEEAEAAESIAWKAVLLGWRGALRGFADDRYFTLHREEETKQ
jgi:hypothetical protein